MASRKGKLQVCVECWRPVNCEWDVETVFIKASSRDHAECVKACLATGVVDVNYCDALWRAVEFGRDDCVEVLVKAGADIHNRIVQTATTTGSERCVKLILKGGGDRDKMLVLATKNSRHNVVELLLREGADANTTINGRTILALAACGDDITCLKLLLEAGADVNRTGICDETAVFYAAANDSAQCLAKLLEAGADVNIKDYYGKTALFEAVCTSSVQCLHLLLQAGADVNIMDAYCKTVLHEEPSCLKGIKKVLDEGVKVNVRNNHGFNALTFHLKNLEVSSFYTRRKTDDKLKERFVQLLFAAGEMIDESKVKKVPHYLKQSEEISLLNICRETIRKHLLKLDDVNLFLKVPQLPLPQLMTSCLLYDVTLDHEEKDSKDE